MTAQKLEYTGERMVPEAADVATFWEHIIRYRLVAPLAHGKRVLDIACGEGYGSAALVAAGAASVVAVDISADVCRHAREKYGLDAREGRGENIPVDDHSIDLLVSFETIEHIPEPVAFINECARVLAPDGRMLISTPDVEGYSDNQFDNPFHCSEMKVSEFLRLLESRFELREIFYQTVQGAPPWSWDAIRAFKSLWNHLRGLPRLRRVAQWVLTPSLFRNTVAIPPAEVTELILGKGHRFDGVLNPYSIRAAYQISKGARYRYVIASCELRSVSNRSR